MSSAKAKQKPAKAKVLDQTFEMVAVDTLKLHERNPNEGDFGAVYTSVETNGFYGAIVVQRSTAKVLVGNHRLMASREAGIPFLPVLWVDVDDEQALRILTADNRTARLGTDNHEALTEILIELAMSPGGLLGTGFDGDDLQAMLDDLNRPPLDDERGPGSNPEPLEVVITCGTGVVNNDLAATLTSLDARMGKVTVPCVDQVEQSRILARLTELGYAAKPKG